MVKIYKDKQEKDEAIARGKEAIENKILTGFGFKLDDTIVYHYPSGANRGTVIDFLGLDNEEEVSEASFKLFEGELRPGSGIIREDNGQPVGLHGCVGLFLDRQEESEDRFFVTSGHLLSEDWKEGAGETVFRSGAGSTGRGRRRAIGKVARISKVEPQEVVDPVWNTVDGAIVRLQPGIEIERDTTCYDGMGDLATTFKGRALKCGNEEPIFTESSVYCDRYWFAIEREVGDQVKRYLFADQLLLESGGFQRPFAKPGDSGCAVIGDSREVFGLILGGSVARDLFIVNRIDHVRPFWEYHGLTYRSSGRSSQVAMTTQAAVRAVEGGKVDGGIVNRRFW